MTPGVYLWRGQTYIGQAAVAEAAGVSVSAVGRHLTRHGHLDYLGTGRSQPGPIGRGGMVVALCGREWPSQRAFAADLGIPPATVRLWLSAGATHRLRAAVLAADARDGVAGHPTGRESELGATDDKTGVSA